MRQVIRVLNTSYLSSLRNILSSWHGSLDSTYNSLIPWTSVLEWNSLRKADPRDPLPFYPTPFTPSGTVRNLVHTDMSMPPHTHMFKFWLLTPGKDLPRGHTWKLNWSHLARKVKDPGGPEHGNMASWWLCGLGPVKSSRLEKNRNWTF